jgi:hypothetical protein
MEISPRFLPFWRFFRRVHSRRVAVASASPRWIYGVWRVSTGAAVFALCWLARNEAQGAARDGADLRGHVARLTWQAPFLSCSSS